MTGLRKCNEVGRTVNQPIAANGKEWLDTDLVEFFDDSCHIKKNIGFPKAKVKRLSCLSSYPLNKKLHKAERPTLNYANEFQ